MRVCVCVCVCMCVCVYVCVRMYVCMCMCCCCCCVCADYTLESWRCCAYTSFEHNAAAVAATGIMTLARQLPYCSVGCVARSSGAAIVCLYCMQRGHNAPYWFFCSVVVLCCLLYLPCSFVVTCLPFLQRMSRVLTGVDTLAGFH